MDRKNKHRARVQKRERARKAAPKCYACDATATGTRAFIVGNKLRPACERHRDDLAAARVFLCRVTRTVTQHIDVFVKAPRDLEATDEAEKRADEWRGNWEDDGGDMDVLSAEPVTVALLCGCGWGLLKVEPDRIPLACPVCGGDLPGPTFPQD